MENTVDNRIYELAYHLTPDLEGDTLDLETKKIESVITQLGGSIVTSQGPEKKRLSYPIDHKRFTFFGYIDFSAADDIVKSINEQFNLSDSVLRYLVISKDNAGSKSMRALIEKPQHAKMAASMKASAQRTAPVKKEKVETSPEEEKKMEAEIEGVLDKL